MADADAPTPPAEDATQPITDVPPVPAAPAAEAAQAEQDMSDLVNRAIARGIPSYEAWALTPDELAQRLES